MITPIAFDLFAGAGGLSTGLELAGFHVAYANEINATYASTLALNHPKTFVDVRDIRSVDPTEILHKMGMRAGELHLLAGGPPCQGFSINAPVRNKEDRRNHLFWSYLRFVQGTMPQYVLIENVPGIVSFEQGDVVRAVLESLRKMGYAAAIRILYAPHYGIPQMRWRAFILASREHDHIESLYPKPTHHAIGRANFQQRIDGERLILGRDMGWLHGLEKPAKVWDALSDLPVIENGGGSLVAPYASPPQSPFQQTLRLGASDEVFNHQCVGLGEVNLMRLRHIPPGGSWRDIPQDLLPQGMQRARRSDHTQRYGRLHKEGVASTILTKCDPHWGAFIHPEQERVLSVREAARLQSFPDRVRFLGSLNAQYEQVGNAVPPLLSYAVARSLYSSDRA